MGSMLGSIAIAITFSFIRFVLLNMPIQALSIYLFDSFSKNPTIISCVLFILYDKYVYKVFQFFLGREAAPTFSAGEMDGGYFACNNPSCK